MSSRGLERASVIVKPSLPDLISRELRAQIASGKVPPGRLKIASLAREFEVSPVPIREALQQLAAEGLVTFEQYRKVVVNALSVEDMRDIFEMRLVLETLALEHAIPLIREKPEVIESLRAEVQAMDGRVDDPDHWRESNRAFHWLAYEVVPKARLLKTIGSLWNAVEPYLRVYMTTPEPLTVAQGEHWAMLQAIVDGDAVAACSVLRTHLLNTVATVEARLRDDPEGAEFDRYGSIPVDLSLELAPPDTR